MPAPHQADQGPHTGHWPDERARLPTRWIGAAMFVLLSVIGVGSLLCIGGAAAGVALLVKNPSLLSGQPGPHPMDTLSGDIMAASFFAGFGTFTVLGFILVLAIGWRPQHALALRWSPIIPLFIALTGGLFVGFFPGWIAQQIVEAFPHLAEQGTLPAIERMMTSGSWASRAGLIFTVTVGAPLLEELCFRGLLWNALERTAPRLSGQMIAFVGTSLAFVLAHFDPVQSPAIVVTALFIGWLRLTSGSLVPCIVAHFVNNSLATAFTLWGDHEMFDNVEGSFPLALTGLALTVGACVLAFLGRARPLKTLDAAWSAREVA
jgi:membrane protease YdiL (CAAX protease family)